MGGMYGSLMYVSLTPMIELTLVSHWGESLRGKTAESISGTNPKEIGSKIA
jgi:hypothetical protein